MIKVVPYEPWHMQLLSRPKNEQDVFFALGVKQVEHVINAGLKQNIVFTALSETKVLAISGIIYQWTGVGEATLFMSSDFFDGTATLGQKLAIARIVRKYMDVIRKGLKLWRVQATVREDFMKGRAFIQWLGFEYEGPMKKFGPDKGDYVRYALVED